MNKYVIALYIRLSVEDYKTESLSINNQKMALRKYAETLDEFDNAEIIELVDNGYSGTNFERPAVQELLELVKSNKVSCIIVKDFSRFGRNSIETGYFIEKVFPLFRIRFISISDGFDSNNFIGETGGLEVAFKYLINEMYSKDLSIKTKSAKYVKMRRGEYQSKICCYGYKKGGNNRLEIDEEVAPVVRVIFELANESKSTRQIIETLYAKKIPTPGEYKASKGTMTHDVSRCHNIWQLSTVLRILADERYTGTYIIGKRAVTEVGSHHVRYKDENEWIKIPDHHPAIIDAVLYESVQSKLRHCKSIKRNIKEYALRGKVFCGCCGHAMSRTGKTPVFTCKYTKVDSSHKCYGLRIKESELEELLYKITLKQAEIILGIASIGSVKDLTEKLKEQCNHEQQIRYFMNKKMRLYEGHLLGEIDDKEYNKQKAVFDAKLIDIKKNHSVLASKTMQMQSENEKKTKLQIIAKDIAKGKTLTRELAQTLIEKVDIFPDNRIEIFWKIEDFSGACHNF